MRETVTEKLLTAEDTEDAQRTPRIAFLSALGVNSAVSAVKSFCILGQE
jgi:hypothetical protein